MIFCGQCGLQLAPGSPSCPRCGAATTPELAMEDMHEEDATYLEPDEQHLMEPPPSAHQQKLVLRSRGGDYEFDGLDANEQTSMTRAPGYPVSPPVSPAHLNTGTPYSSFAPHHQVHSSATQRASYAGEIDYQPVSGQYGSRAPVHSQAAGHSGKGRITALLLILLGLLLVLSAMVVFIAKPAWIFQGNHAAPTTAASTTPLSPTEQARNVIQQYFVDINQQDYQSAYNLWGSKFHQEYSLDAFTAGYAHTKHNDLTINNTENLSDGTVRVFVTIVATEQRGARTVYSTYRGTYTVGQENGTWKLLSGYFYKVR